MHILWINLLVYIKICRSKLKRDLTISFMPLFSLSRQLKRIKDKPFSTEREMQRLVEDNLGEVFGLKLIATEFAPQGDLRIDTLAFDVEQESFVIIEYKNGGSWSVIDQGATYLSLLLDRKEAFVLKLNEVLRVHRTVKSVNWEASRIVFISPGFNTYQQGALGFRDLPMELWEIKRYENNVIALNPVQSTQRNAKIAELNVQSGELKKVQREVKNYTVDDHFKDNWDESRGVFDVLTPLLLALNADLEVKPVKSYIGIKMGTKNVFSIHVYKSCISLHFPRSQPKDFKDPEKRVEYVKDCLKYYNQHISYFTLTQGEEDIPYALMLAKQVLRQYI